MLVGGAVIVVEPKVLLVGEAVVAVEVEPKRILFGGAVAVARVDPKRLFAGVAVVAVEPKLLPELDACPDV